MTPADTTQGTVPNPTPRERTVYVVVHDNDGLPWIRGVYLSERAAQRQADTKGSRRWSPSLHSPDRCCEVVSAPFDDFFYATDYGAVADDGITDCTPAFQQAIDNAATYGGSVATGSPGTFLISEPIGVGGVEVRGNG